MSAYCADYRLRIPETLSDDILAKMHAPAKPDYPVIKPADLTQYDAFLLGVPTRYGNFPAQWKVRGSFQLFLLDIFSRLSWQSFWDATGGLWASGALLGKYAGVFVSTGTPGGGQETTVISTLSTLAHHGIIYVPMGYGEAFHILSNLSEVRGGEHYFLTFSLGERACADDRLGSPWGSGTFSAGDGSRQPSELEIQLAIHHGKYFYNTVKKAF